MSSSLRFSSSLPVSRTSYSIHTTTSSSPQKKKKMSLMQTYSLAHTARAKLSREAARSDKEIRLRLLVGHANLLDGIMLDLAEAEREQESWFNQSVKGASKASEEPKHIQWADSLPAVMEEDDDEDSSEDESDGDEEEIGYMSPPPPLPLRRAPSPPPTVITAIEVDMEDEEDNEDQEMEEDDDEDMEGLALTRTSSRTPPDLLHESDSESDDDSMPPSPPLPQTPFEPFSKPKPATLFPSDSQSHSAPIDIPTPRGNPFDQEGLYVPQRQPITIY